MTKTILYVLPERESFWSYRAPLARAMAQQGFAVHIAAPGAADDSRLREAGFTGHDLPEMPRGPKPLALACSIFMLRYVLARIRPDIVHVFTLKYAFMAGLAALGRPSSMLRVYTIAGLGYVFSGAGFKPEMLRLALSPLFRLVFRSKARLIFQNPDDRAVFLRAGFVRPDNAILIRGSGIDTAAFAPTPDTEETPPLVLMPTRLLRDKGVDVFIAAAKILAAENINASFMIAGGLDPQNPAALTEADMRNLLQSAPGVVWAGKVTGMPPLYARCALVAFPSWYREGLPRVLLEGAAMGKALITTDHPGCREAVQHGVNGLLIPPRDAGALAAAIRELLADPERRSAMGHAGRDKALREFDSALIVQQNLAVYARPPHASP